MSYVTNLMIDEYGLRKLKMDMMGYKIVKSDDYSFHHLIIPKRECKERGIESNGYQVWNGAILNRNTGHPYLHAIENIDRDRFLRITSELIDVNMQGYIDRKNLVRIYKLLEEFEEKHSETRVHSGKLLIKREYKERFDLNDDELCNKLEEVKRKILTKRK